MNEAIITLIVTSIIGPMLTWFLTRRRYSADTKLAELDSVEKAISIWRKLAEDLGKELKAVRDEVMNLRETESGLRLEVIKLSEANNQLHKEMTELKQQLQRLENISNTK